MTMPAPTGAQAKPAAAGPTPPRWYSRALRTFSLEAETGTKIDAERATEPRPEARPPPDRAAPPRARDSSQALALAPLAGQLPPGALPPVPSVSTFSSQSGGSPIGAIGQTAQAGRSRTKGMPGADRPTTRLPVEPAAHQRPGRASKGGSGQARRGAAPEPTAAGGAQSPGEVQASPAEAPRTDDRLTLPPAAQEDASLRIQVLPRSAVLSLEGQDGERLALRMFVKDGVADVRATGPAAELLGAHQSELRLALANAGLSLGGLDLGDSNRRGAPDPDRTSAGPRPAIRPVTLLNTGESDTTLTLPRRRGRMHVTA
jgi:hypothetical protein